MQVALTGASEYVDPSAARLKMLSSFDKYVELYCHKSTVWFLIPLVYNILLMLVCAVIGFITRKLPDNFNESWFIFVSVSTTLFAWVVFIPAYFTSSHVYLQPAILGFCLILICFVTLGCQFGPIIYVIIFLPADKTKVLTFKGTSVFNANTASVKPVELS
jgi:4-amino-4-deoxy-L-arabinose transferase-like glycosyltransferase